MNANRIKRIVAGLICFACLGGYVLFAIVATAIEWGWFALPVWLGFVVFMWAVHEFWGMKG